MSRRTNKLGLNMRRKRKTNDSILSVHWPVMLLVFGVVALISGALYMGSRSTPEPPKTEATDVAYYSRVEDAKPFPAMLEPETFTHPQVRHAYVIAKQMPDVLAQQPCYCYCKRRGHRSLLDCFATKHAADCDICVREAIFAKQEREKGKSASEIRTEIMGGAWKSIQVTN